MTGFACAGSDWRRCRHRPGDHRDALVGTALLRASASGRHREQPGTGSPAFRDGKEVARPQAKASTRSASGALERFAAPIYTRKSSEEGLSRSSTRSMRSARPAKPTSAARSTKAGPPCRRCTTTAASPAAPWSGRRSKRLLADIAGRPRRHRGGLQGRPPDAIARRLRQDRRGLRRQGRVVRFGHAGVQHDHLDGAADAQHAAVLRPVRARGHRRAHPRQDRRLEAEGHVDGRPAAARLRRPGSQARRQRAEADTVRHIFRRYAS